jgi:hypothetical protein
MIPDDSDFAGINAESLPEVDYDFSCKSDTPPAQADVAVDLFKKDDEGGEVSGPFAPAAGTFDFSGTFIRLPVVEAETWENKDGASDLIRTSRVKVPMIWGGVEIHELVGADREDEDAGFDLCRISYRDRDTGRWQVQQFGYVASIGPASENGVLKFYTYDPADFMREIPVTKTYDEPTASQIANFVAFDNDYGLEFNNPVPVIDATVTTPASRIEAAVTDDVEVDIVGQYENLNNKVYGWIDDNIADRDIPILVDAFIFNREVLDRKEAEEWVDEALHSGGHKHFRRNRHNLVDVMDWLTDRIGGSWFLQPEETGVTLVVNNGGEAGDSMARRSFKTQSVDPSQYNYIQGTNHSDAIAINNNAIEDIKPINKLTLNGESADSFLGLNADRDVFDGPLGAPRGQTNKYPHVEVTYPPLLKRAGGVELGPKRIESEATTTAEAREEAIQAFISEHEDNTEGEIVIYGKPTIRPYDYMSSKPVCNDVFDIDANPIQYEINSVKHHVKNDEPYQTELGVSIALNEDIVRENAVDDLLDVRKNEQ